MKKIPKIKLPSLKRRRKVLWELCKQITRKRYIKPDGTWNCYTCGKKIVEPGKCQTGHCIPSCFGGLRLRYRLNNLRIQCFFCNINAGGVGSVYLRKLQKEIGDQEIDSMFELLDKRKDKVDNEREFIESLIVEYRIILSGLK